MPRTSVDAPARTAQALFLIVIAALACTTSIVISVRFCWGLRGEDGVTAGLLAVALGLSWELSKLVFGPLGVRLALSGRPVLSAGGIGLCTLAAVLVAGSVLASLGYFLERDARGQQRTLASSRQYRDLQAQLTALDGQIATLTQTAKLDTQASYRKRALATMAHVERLRLQRHDLSNALLAWEKAPQTHAQAGMVSSLAALFGVDFGRMRWLAYGVVALMLELISLTAIVLLSAQRTRPEPVALPRSKAILGDSTHDDDTLDPPAPPMTGPRCRNTWAEPVQVPNDTHRVPSSPGAAMHLGAEPESPESSKAASADTESATRHSTGASARAGAGSSAEPETRSESADPEKPESPEAQKCTKGSVDAPSPKAPNDGTECQSDPKYDEAKHLILSGAVAPRYRDLKLRLHIGQQAVQRYLRAMIEEGCISRCGRKYVPAMAET